MKGLYTDFSDEVLKQTEMGAIEEVYNSCCEIIAHAKHQLRFALTH